MSHDNRGAATTQPSTVLWNWDSNLAPALRPDPTADSKSKDPLQFLRQLSKVMKEIGEPLVVEFSRERDVLVQEGQVVGRELIGWFEKVRGEFLNQVRAEIEVDEAWGKGIEKQLTFWHKSLHEFTENPLLRPAVNWIGTPADNADVLNGMGMGLWASPPWGNDQFFGSKELPPVVRGERLVRCKPSSVDVYRDALDSVWRDWLKKVPASYFDYLGRQADSVWGAIQCLVDPSSLWLEAMCAPYKVWFQSVAKREFCEGAEHLTLISWRAQRILRKRPIPVPHDDEFNNLVKLSWFMRFCIERVLASAEVERRGGRHRQLQVTSTIPLSPVTTTTPESVIIKYPYKTPGKVKVNDRRFDITKHKSVKAVFGDALQAALDADPDRRIVEPRKVTLQISGGTLSAFKKWWAAYIGPGNPLEPAGKRGKYKVVWQIKAP